MIDIITKQIGLKSLKEQSILYDLLGKIHFATFGSIYISPNITEKIDIVQYIALIIR